MKRLIIISLSLLLLGSMVFLKSETRILAEKLPQDYTFEEAIKNGDIAMDNSLKVYNLNSLTRFLKSIKDHEQDKVRITEVSVEGDIIIQYLAYDGRNLVITFDPSRDHYGPQDIKKYNLKSIKKEIQKGTVYINIVLKDGKKDTLFGYEEKNVVYSLKY